MTEVTLISAQKNTKLDSHDRNSVNSVPIEKLTPARFCIAYRFQNHRQNDRSSVE